MTRIDRFGNYLQRLWACERGAVAPLVGVCIIMLIGSVAVAVDIGRGQVAQSKLQSSLELRGPGRRRDGGPEPQRGSAEARG